MQRREGKGKEKMEQAIDKTARALASLGHAASGKDHGPSKSFQLLIKNIGEAKTKHEEDRIIKREAAFLKEKVGARDVTPRQMREYLIRLIYCEMLGVDCSWGYIHAVKMTQSHSTIEKRIGYLAASLFLHSDHEQIMLLVNTLQRDLKSSNMLEVSTALIIICKLIGSEMIPPLLPLIQDKLLHPKELVRKKAIMTMYHFYKISPGSVTHLEDDFRRALSDQDPGVMEAALVLFRDMTKDNPHQYKDLAGSFTSILQQVINRKLPSDFDYHGVPAPWIQMSLLRVMAVLGADDLKTSEEFYSAIEETLACAECNSNIGQAISYECIRTITSIYPNNSLIEKAGRAVARFVHSTSSNNWKYLGINALGLLVQINPKYAADHQMIVIDCLDDPDDTLKRKTLDLLFKMTNPMNVVVIADRLIGYLRQTRDEYIRSDLVARITQLAERFAPDNQWFLQTMNAVFELGGSLVRREVAHNLMRLIAEGTDDEDTDAELRLDAVSAYVDLLDKPNLPDILVKIICWVVGEYAYVKEDMDIEEILEKVTLLLGRRFEETDTHGWVITAITKLVSQLGHMPESVQNQVALYLTSTNTDIQQRCSELVELSQDFAVMQAVLPLDSSCEDLEVDSSLSFLDGFVSEAMAQGAQAYQPPHLRSNAVVPKPQPSQPAPIKFEPYAQPPPSSVVFHVPPSSSSPQTTPPTERKEGSSSFNDTPPTIHSSRVSTVPDFSYQEPKENVTGIGHGVKRVWGRGGYKRESGTETPPTATPTVVRQQMDTVEPMPPEQPEMEEDSSSTTTALSSVQASILPQSAAEAKKHQLASQLFGGLSGPSRAPKSKQQRKSPTASTSSFDTTTTSSGSLRPPRQVAAAVKKQPKEPQVDLLLDLEGIDFSSPAVAPEQTTGTGVQPEMAMMSPGLSGGVGGGGLLANMEIRGATQDAKVTTSAPPTTSTNLLDLLDGPLLSTPSQPTISENSTSLQNSTPISPAASGGSILSPQTTSDFSLLDPSPMGSKPQLSTSEAQPTLALTLFEKPIGSVRVPQQYASFPVSPGWENKDLCQDANLRVSLTKVLKSDQLVLVLFLTNQKQKDVTNVSLTIETPSNMKAATSSGGKDLSLTTDIPGFGNVTHVVTLVPTSPAINMSIRGHISYRDSMATQRRLFFDASIYVADIIRPLEITTEEFSKKWGTFTYEKKLKLQYSVSKPEEFMEAVKSKLNLHLIQIIGKEVITGGNYLPSTMCLAHCKVQKSHVDFWVRTSSSLLTESIVKFVQMIFK